MDGKSAFSRDGVRWEMVVIISGVVMEKYLRKKYPFKNKIFIKLRITDENYPILCLKIIKTYAKYTKVVCFLFQFLRERV